MGSNPLKKNKVFSVISFPMVLLIGATLLLLFVSGAECDLSVTGNNAWLMLDSKFFNFYEVVSDYDNSFTANYLPTTYIIYAIWILPLKILGFKRPATVASNCIPYIMWYKLLPTLFYAASTYLVYLIAKKIDLCEEKAILAAFLFATSPVAVYSQFIFSQYDAFTTFFILLGIYYFLSDNTKGFIIGFAVATSLKYYAVVFFAVFLLVKEKKVERIFLNLLGCGSLVAFYFVLFFRSVAFRNCIFGFNALDYVSHSDFSTLLGNVSFMQVAALIVLAWAYFTKAETKEKQVRWSLFFSCGVCFAFFGLSTFHPQWLLIAVPFWILCAMTNTYSEIFIWLDMLFGFVLYLFIYEYWYAHADNIILRNGVFAGWLNGRQMRKYIADISPYRNRDQMYTIIVALILIFFVFNHPKFAKENVNDDKDHLMKRRSLMYLRAFVGPVIFIIPTALCLVSTFRHPPKVAICDKFTQWRNASSSKECSEVFTARFDSLSEITFAAVQEEGKLRCNDLVVKLVRASDNELLYIETIPSKEIATQISHTIEFEEPIPLEVGEEYKVIFNAEGTRKTKCLIGSGDDEADMYDGCYAIVDGRRSTCDLYIIFTYEG